MSTKDIAISVLAVSLVVTGVFLFKKPILVEVNVPKSDVVVGAVSGSEFHDGLYTTGIRSKDGVIASNLARATLTAKDICDNNIVNLSYATSVQAVTLPSGTNLMADCFRTVEFTRVVYLHNASTSAQSTQILPGASSSIFSSNLASTTDATLTRGTTTIVNAASARLTGIRTTSSSVPWIFWYIEPFKDR